MYPEFANRSNLSLATHPGTVTFVGPDGTEREERADQIPDWLKFAPDATGAAVPVVRVVRVVEGRGYSLRSFAADGRLLWVGTSVPAATLSDVGSAVRNTSATRSPATSQEPRRSTPRAVSTGWF